jgi:hypothetical protein
MLALVTTTALIEPLPVPKPQGPDGSWPHRYIGSGSYCTSSLVAADAIAKPRWLRWRLNYRLDLAVALVKIHG